MAKNYQRDERDWRSQQQNRPGQNRWPGKRHDEDYERRGQGQEAQDWSGPGQQSRHWSQDWNQGQPGRDWHGQDEGRNRSDVGGRWSRGQGMQEPQRPWAGGNDPEGREGNYGTDSRLSEMNEGYGHLGGRGWYEGWNDAMHREGQYSGRGPRNYKRSDSRIEEEINERLTHHSMIDATDIEVGVQNGEVTLRGHVDSRQAKRLAEDIADSVFGSNEVNNQIKVKQRGGSEESRAETETSGKQRKAS